MIRRETKTKNNRHEKTAIVAVSARVIFFQRTHILFHRMQVGQSRVMANYLSTRRVAGSHYSIKKWTPNFSMVIYISEPRRNQETPSNFKNTGLTWRWD